MLSSITQKNGIPSETFTYTGDGATSRTHTFSRIPKIVIIQAYYDIIICVQGLPYASHTHAYSRGGGAGGGYSYSEKAWSRIDTTWSGNSVTIKWGDGSYGDNDPKPAQIGNTSGTSYKGIVFY